jgi:hypothetical protein
LKFSAPRSSKRGMVRVILLLHGQIDLCSGQDQTETSDVALVKREGTRYN